MAKYNYQKRWAAVQAKLDAQRIDAYVCKNHDNLKYLSCAHIPSSPIVSSIIIPRTGNPVAITSSLEEFRAKRECAIDDIRVYSPYPDVPRAGDKEAVVLKKLLSEMRAKKTLRDTDKRIAGAAGKQDDLIERMREHKDSHEIASIKKACAIADWGAKAIEDELLYNCTNEADIANELDYMLRERGAQCMAFPTIVASGPNSAFSHHDATQREMQKGDSVICDFGVYVDGYCSDLTRTFFLGKARPELAEAYDAVASAQDDAISSLKSGIRYSSIDTSIRAYFRKLGFARNFVHSTGHGIGLNVHEAPSVSLVSKSKAENGHTITIEPGIYLPGLGGIRIEDDVLIQGGRAVLLTKAKKARM